MAASLQSPTAAPKRERLANASLAIALGTATLWDYRLFDLRIFDGVALASLLGFLLLTFEPLDGFLRRRRDFWLLFTTIVAYAALGFALHGHRSSLAIIALGVIGFILIGRRDWLAATRLFQWLLIAHIVFFLIQFLTFYLFKMTIDFQTVVGAQSRVDARVYQIRAAGLFQEPNSYCLNVFVLGTMIILQRAGRLFVLAAAATMALSESIWGVGAAFVLLLLDAIFRCRSPWQMATRLFAFALAIAVVFNAYLWLTKRPGEALPYFYTRVLSITNDESTDARYLRNNCSSTEQAAMTKVPPKSRPPSWVFGEGLSTHFFMGCMPTNGVAFLLKSLGIIGSIALLIGFALALRGLPVGAKLYAAIAIGFSFTTYPLVTYVIFWLWLPAIIALLHLRNSEPDSANVPAAHSLVA